MVFTWESQTARQPILIPRKTSDMRGMGSIAVVEGVGDVSGGGDSEVFEGVLGGVILYTWGYSFRWERCREVVVIVMYRFENRSGYVAEITKLSSNPVQEKLTNRRKDKSSYISSYNKPTSTQECSGGETPKISWSSFCAKQNIELHKIKCLVKNLLRNKEFVRLQERLKIFEKFRGS